VRHHSLFNEEGQIEAVPSNGCDVTQAQDSQTGRKQIEARHRTVDASLQFVWTASATGDFQTADPALLAFTGLTEEEVSGVRWLQAIHPDDRDRCRHIWRQAIAAKSAYEFEFRVRRYDSGYRDCTMRGIPVLDTEGDIREWVGAIADVTEQKQVERDLITRAAVLDNMAEGVVMSDDTGTIAFSTLR